MENKFRDPVRGLKYLSREVENIIYAYGKTSSRCEGLDPLHGIKVGSTVRTLTERYKDNSFLCGEDGSMVLVGIWSVGNTGNLRQVENWFHSVLRSDGTIKAASGGGRERFLVDLDVLTQKFGASHFQVSAADAKVKVKTLFLGRGLVGSVLDDDPDFVRETFTLRSGDVFSSNWKALYDLIVAGLIMDGITPDADDRRLVWEFINKVPRHKDSTGLQAFGITPAPGMHRTAKEGLNTQGLAARFDELGIALTATYREAYDELVEADGKGRRRKDILEALKYRRDRELAAERSDEEPHDTPPGDTPTQQP